VLLLNRSQLTPNFPRGADAWEEFWLEVQIVTVLPARYDDRTLASALRL
jgi:hypothetical protein